MVCPDQKMHWRRNKKVQGAPEELSRFLTQERHHPVENVKPDSSPSPCTMRVPWASAGPSKTWTRRTTRSVAACSALNKSPHEGFPLCVQLMPPGFDRNAVEGNVRQTGLRSLLEPLPPVTGTHLPESLSLLSCVKWPRGFVAVPSADFGAVGGGVRI